MNHDFALQVCAKYPKKRELRLQMLRKLTWIEKPGLAGWGCSECDWLFQVPCVPAGKSPEAVLRMIEELQRNREFASHVCNHYRRNKS
jgi:hypothetical protein